MDMKKVQEKHSAMATELAASKKEVAHTQVSGLFLICKRDMQIMGEKLIDEIEQRSELQHSHEAVKDELENLTKDLFEEGGSPANFRQTTWSVLKQNYDSSTKLGKSS